MKLNSLIPELACADFKASLKFYTDILGFSILYQRQEEGFAMLEYQGSQLMIDEILEGTRNWLTGDMQKPYGRGINLQINTNDATALYNKIKNFHIPVFLELEDKWYRQNDIYVGNRQFLLQDPDGYLLRFAEDLGDRSDAPPQ